MRTSREKEMTVGETEKESEMWGGGAQSEHVTDTEERAAERMDCLLSLPGSQVSGFWLRF